MRRSGLTCQELINAILSIVTGDYERFLEPAREISVLHLGATLVMASIFGFYALRHFSRRWWKRRRG